MARLPTNPFGVTTAAGDSNPFESDVPPTGGTDPIPPGGGTTGASGFGDYLFNQNPYAGVAAYEQRGGIDPTGAFGRFLGTQTNNLYNGYTAASVNDPNLNFLDYLGSQRPSMDNWFGVAQTANYAPVRRGR